MDLLFLILFLCVVVGPVIWVANRRSDRWKNFAILIAFMLASPSVEAQQPSTGFPGNKALFLRPTPEKRRADRDVAAQRVGDQVYEFAKRYPEWGVAAILRCTPESGKKLVELKGALERLPAPEKVLELCALHGDCVADWVAEKHEQLVDPVAFAIFCREPRDVVFDLIDLERAAAQQRKTKQAPHADESLLPLNPSGTLDWRWIAGIGGGIAVGFLVSRFLARRSAESA